MKKIAALLAIVGVLTASVPAMASASTVQNHANTLGSTSSYSVMNILPNGTATNTWGTDTLTSDNTNQRFFWQVSPTNASTTYTYWLEIDYYSDYNYTKSLGRITIPTVVGAGVQSGYVAFPGPFLENGLYYAKIFGLWNAPDGAQGYVPEARTSFTVNQ